MMNAINTGIALMESVSVSLAGVENTVISKFVQMIAQVMAFAKIGGVYVTTVGKVQIVIL
jgi:hypothetical protein